MVKALGFIVALVLCASPAFAAAPELCGNGIDDPLQTGGSANGTKGLCPDGYMDAVIGNGCDLKCPGLDADKDGYTSDGSLGTAGTTYTDCDDNDRRVIPGEYVPNSYSSPTGYKLCQTNGTFASTILNSTTPLCEATGSGVCKYIDCSAGNNSNAGTYAAPYLTLSKVSGGSGASLPASPYTLTAGSVVYLLDGDCTTVIGPTFGGGTMEVIAHFNQDGTTGDPIVIKNYPGSDATITNTDGGGILVEGDNYRLKDLELVTDENGSGNGFGIFSANNANVYISNVYSRDSFGNGDNNDAAIYFTHSSGGQLRRSYIKDFKRGTGSVDNTGAVKWLDDQDIATECENHVADHNTIWYTTFSATDGGDCFRQKHGCDAEDVGSGKHQIRYNTCVNARRVVHWNSSSLRFSHNISYAVPNILYMQIDGTTAPHEDNEITFNTFIDSSMINWRIPSYGNADSSLTISDNVFIDNDTSYSAGDNEGIISIDGYGSDAEKAEFESDGYLTSSANCFYNASTALVFSYYAIASGGGGHGPAGNAGANYSFANWQSVVGQDAGSYSEHPSLDAWKRATTTNCDDMGWMLVTEPEPGPTPTPTPTTIGGGKGNRFFRGRR